jgi:hypothetical protein
MPYIKESNRSNLNNCIEEMIVCLKRSTDNEKLTNDELLNISGDINYCFSRIISNVMGDTTYPKIAIITGVLENIKQEFYRRVAESYEDKKILENGDIKEYKRLN